MEVTRDDDQFLIVESNTVLAWLIAGAVGLSPLATALFLHQVGNDWTHTALAFLGFGPLACLLIHLAPRTLFCFNLEARKLLVKRSWPWGSKEEVVPFKAIKGVSVDRVYGKHGPSYRPVLTLRDGRTLSVSQLTQAEQAVSSHIVERIGTFLNAARAAGKGPTDKLRKPAPPVEVAAAAKPEKPINLVASSVMALLAVGLIGYEAYDNWSDHRERQERHARTEARGAQRAEQERQAAQHRGSFHRDLQAAQAGDAQAMVRVAKGYANATGTRKDADKALAWTQKAVAQDVPDAYALMGHLYMHGGPVPRNLVEAEKWYRQASERGSAEGLYGLSTVFYLSDGYPQDLAKAHAYMVLSARGNFGNAASAVNIIGGKLSPEQREQSRLLVETWDREHPGIPITS